MTKVEEKIQEKIVDILQSVNQAIPVDWTEVYINIEMSDTGGGVFFDFKPKNSSEFHYSVLISEEFDVRAEHIEHLFDAQFELGYELWKLFVDNDLPIWSSAVISYTNNKMRIEFDYTSWITSKFSPTDRRNFYKYRYLGAEPRNDAEKELFKNMSAFYNRYNDQQVADLSRKLDEELKYSSEKEGFGIENGVHHVLIEPYSADESLEGVILYAMNREDTPD